MNGFVRIVFIGGIETHTLFDSGASHSFVRPEVLARWESKSGFEGGIRMVQAAGGAMLKLHAIYRDVSIVVGGENLPGDLIVLETKGYEAILGMDWLAHYRANLDCEKCRVTFTRKEGKLVFQGKKKESGIPVISALRAERMVEKGCESFLATITIAGGDQEGLLGEIPVVQEFEDVFQKLTGLPPTRDEPFTIELEPGTTPISKTPYRMAPIEMAELKKQLEELIEKGFI